VARLLFAALGWKSVREKREDMLARRPQTHIVRDDATGLTRYVSESSSTPLYIWRFGTRGSRLPACHASPCGLAVELEMLE